MEKSDDAAMEIVDVEAGSMTFDNENSEWSLLPEPTLPRSPTIAVSDKDFSTPKKTPHTSLVVSI